MKRFFLLLNGLFLISIFIVSSVYAVSCSKQEVRNPHKAKWSNDRESTLLASASSQSDPYSQAEALFKEKKYDDVIDLLSDLAKSEPNNFKLNILLAKAQVEKCAILNNCAICRIIFLDIHCDFILKRSVSTTNRMVII